MTKYKYTKKNCYTVAKSIIDCINYNQERGLALSHCDIYLYEYGGNIRGYVHEYGEGLWLTIYEEKGRNVPHTYNWIEITDWFRDRAMYTKKELANMIYNFYEVF